MDNVTWPEAQLVYRWYFDRATLIDATALDIWSPVRGKGAAGGRDGGLLKAVGKTVPGLCRDIKLSIANFHDSSVFPIEGSRLWSIYEMK